MSTAEVTELTEVLNRVKNWSPESRIVLARRILKTLEAPTRPMHGLPARSLQELIGLGRAIPWHPMTKPSNFWRRPRLTPSRRRRTMRSAGRSSKRNL
jgi:hypothetical protein